MTVFFFGWLVLQGLVAIGIFAAAFGSLYSDGKEPNLCEIELYKPCQ